MHFREPCKLIDMSTITFDTLKFADTLKASGIPDKQAEAQARAVAAAIGEVDVATRRDIDDLRREILTMEQRLTIKLGAFITVAAGTTVALVKLL